MKPMITLYAKSKIAIFPLVIER